MTKFQEIAGGFYFPEGPVVMPDGSIIITEIGARKVSRVTRSVRSRDGGGNWGPQRRGAWPKRLALCLRQWRPGFLDRARHHLSGGQSADYKIGSIKTLDLKTGAFRDLYTRFGEGLPLKSPNDLVFDRHGGFYFSEHGKMRDRDHDLGGVFYAKADGSEIVELANHMHGPNGVGLSPDHKTLYVAETWSRQLWAFPIEAPGKLGRDPKALFGHGSRHGGAPGFRFFDSLADWINRQSASRRREA